MRVEDRRVGFIFEEAESKMESRKTQSYKASALGHLLPHYKTRPKSLPIFPMNIPDMARRQLSQPRALGLGVKVLRADAHSSHWNPVKVWTISVSPA